MKKIFLLLLLGIALACNQNQRQDVQDVGEEMEDAANQIGNDISHEWTSMTNSLEDYNDRLNQRIKKIEMDMENAGAQAKVELQEEKQDLEAWSEKVKARMRVTQQEAGKDWNHFKNETKEYFRELDDKLRGES